MFFYVLPSVSGLTGLKFVLFWIDNLMVFNWLTHKFEVT